VVSDSSPASLGPVRGPIPHGFRFPSRLDHEATQSRGDGRLLPPDGANRPAAELPHCRLPAKSFTPGCTIKAHQFAEAFDSFAAAIELSIGQDEDLGVRLLEDIRDLFDLRPGIDRLTSAAMVDCLLELPDGLWSEWRGPQDNQVPHRMSQGGLATMLAPFGIRSRTNLASCRLGW